MDLREITKRYIKENGITYAAVARYMGVSRSYFHHWIQGDYDMPDYRLEQITDFLQGKAYKSLDDIRREID